MEYRILVDENTSPVVAELLRERGYDAAHVNDALRGGVADRRIVEFAATNGHVVLTNDTDFLRPARTRCVPVLYYGDDTLSATEIVGTVERVIELVPEPTDLPRPTSLAEWTD